MKNALIASVIAVTSIVFAGCGAASAPPVDMPAPIVGKITATPPDEEGMTTITGTEGSVEPGMYVLAINSRLVEDATAAWLITDMLMRSAHAQSLPVRCTETGRGCSLADELGQFSLRLPVWILDKIFLVIMDANGYERSPRVEIEIPSADSIATCVDAPVSGALVNLYNALGFPIALYQGNGETSNTLLAGDKTIPLPGCYAKSFASLVLALDDITLAIASPDDHTLWIGRWNGQGMYFGKRFVLDDAPHLVAFDGNPTHVLAVVQTATGMALNKIAIADGSIIESIQLPDPGIPLTDVIAFDTIGPFPQANSDWLGVVVTSGPGPSETQYYATLIETTTMVNSAASGGSFLLKDDFFPFLDGYDFRDVQFGMTTNVSVVPIMLMLSDYGNQSLYVLLIEDDTTTDIVALNTATASTLEGNINLRFPPMGEIYETPPVSPTRFALGVTGTHPTAYVLTGEGKLWKIGDYPQGSGSTRALVDLPGISAPAFIAVNDPVMSLLIGDDVTGDIVDFSSLWGGGL